MKRIFALVVSTLTIGFASAAHAQIYTYVFTGTGTSGIYPDSFVDGSTVTINNGVITDYDFQAPGFGHFATPATTSIITDTVTSYDHSGWTGNLDMTYSTIHIDVTGDSFTSPELGASIQGTWTAVPDGASTLALFGAVSTGLMAWRTTLRRRN